MSCLIPPLPGEPLFRVKAVADQRGVTVGAIYNLIHDGRLSAITVDGRYYIAESEAERLKAEWPSNNRGVTARWAEYRAWKSAQRAAEVAA